LIELHHRTDAARSSECTHQPNSPIARALQNVARLPIYHCQLSVVLYHYQLSVVPLNLGRPLHDSLAETGTVALTRSQVCSSTSRCGCAINEHTEYHTLATGRGTNQLPTNQASRDRRRRGEEVEEEEDIAALILINAGQLEVARGLVEVNGTNLAPTHFRN
jgi:hypothetical protein